MSTPEGPGKRLQALGVLRSLGLFLLGLESNAAILEALGWIRLISLESNAVILEALAGGEKISGGMQW